MMAAAGTVSTFHAIGVASLAVAVGSVALTGLLLIGRHDVAIGIVNAVRGHKQRTPKAQLQTRKDLVKRPGAIARLSWLIKDLFSSIAGLRFRVLCWLRTHGSPSRIARVDEISRWEITAERKALKIYKRRLSSTDLKLLRIARWLNVPEAEIRVAMRDQAVAIDKLSRRLDELRTTTDRDI